MVSFSKPADAPLTYNKGRQCNYRTVGLPGEGEQSNCPICRTLYEDGFYTRILLLNCRHHICFHCMCETTNKRVCEQCTEPERFVGWEDRQQPEDRQRKGPPKEALENNKEQQQVGEEGDLDLDPEGEKVETEADKIGEEKEAEDEGIGRNQEANLTVQNNQEETLAELLIPSEGNPPVFVDFNQENMECEIAAQNMIEPQVASTSAGWDYNDAEEQPETSEKEWWMEALEQGPSKFTRPCILRKDEKSTPFGIFKKNLKITKKMLKPLKPAGTVERKKRKYRKRQPVEEKQVSVEKPEKKAAKANNKNKKTLTKTVSGKKKAVTAKRNRVCSPNLKKLESGKIEKSGRRIIRNPVKEPEKLKRKYQRKTLPAEVITQKRVWKPTEKIREQWEVLGARKGRKNFQKINEKKEGEKCLEKTQRKKQQTLGLKAKQPRIGKKNQLKPQQKGRKKLENKNQNEPAPEIEKNLENKKRNHDSKKNAKHAETDEIEKPVKIPKSAEFMKKLKGNKHQRYSKIPGKFEPELRVRISRRDQKISQLKQKLRQKHSTDSTALDKDSSSSVIPNFVNNPGFRNYVTSCKVKMFLTLEQEITRKYVCSRCNARFKKQLEMLLHFMSHVRQNLDCGICHVPMRRRFALEKHVSEEHFINIHVLPYTDIGCEDYCPECQTQYELGGKEKTEFMECGHRCCLECVWKCELGCGKCVLEHALAEDAKKAAEKEQSELSKKPKKGKGRAKKVKGGRKPRVSGAGKSSGKKKVKAGAGKRSGGKGGLAY